MGFFSPGALYSRFHGAESPEAAEKFGKTSRRAGEFSRFITFRQKCTRRCNVIIITIIIHACVSAYRISSRYTCFFESLARQTPDYTVNMNASLAPGPTLSFRPPPPSPLSQWGPRGWTPFDIFIGAECSPHCRKSIDSFFLCAFFFVSFKRMYIPRCLRGWLSTLFENRKPDGRSIPRPRPTHGRWRCEVACTRVGGVYYLYIPVNIYIMCMRV